MRPIICKLVKVSQDNLGERSMILDMACEAVIEAKYEPAGPPNSVGQYLVTPRWVYQVRCGGCGYESEKKECHVVSDDFVLKAAARELMAEEQYLGFKGSCMGGACRREIVGGQICRGRESFPETLPLRKCGQDTEEKV